MIIIYDYNVLKQNRHNKTTDVISSADEGRHGI